VSQVCSRKVLTSSREYSVPRLPKWDMEQFLEQKSVATCANFPTGRWSALPGRTSIESCTQCELGKYGIKDGAVSEAFCIECPPFSDSTVLGANTTADCVCSRGSYWVPWLKSCSPCINPGITCPGGIASSGDHAPPQSVKGWYMVSLATAQRCKHQLPDGRSVCRGGCTVKRDNHCCSEWHRGPFCSACEPGCARDNPAEACPGCSRVWATGRL